MGDITNNISLSETICHCGCQDSLKISKRNVHRQRILPLAQEIQKLITILSLIYQEQKIIALFKWGDDGGSWFRCQSHNKTIGGAKNSVHMNGLATDTRFYLKNQTHKIQIPNLVVCRTALVASKEGLLNFKGIGCYRTFSHLDVRYNMPAQWMKDDSGKYHYGQDFKIVGFGGCP